MNFHEIFVMAIAILGIQAGVYRRPMTGTYILKLQEVLMDQGPGGNAQQPASRFKLKADPRANL